jgi:hypothetical protein
LAPGLAGDQRILRKKRLFVHSTGFDVDNSSKKENCRSLGLHCLLGLHYIPHHFFGRHCHFHFSRVKIHHVLISSSIDQSNADQPCVIALRLS